MEIQSIISENEYLSIIFGSFQVNANTDTKSTVSVIRVGSPTPSMETYDEDSTKQSDDDENDQSNDESRSSGECNEESDQDDDDIEKKQKHKKKNKIPGIGLTVEDFYNPEQAVQFATEIMSKMKEITLFLNDLLSPVKQI